MAKKYIDANELCIYLTDHRTYDVFNYANMVNDDIINCLLEYIDEMPEPDVVEINCAYNEKEDTPSLFRCSNCNWYCNDTTPGDKTDGDDPYGYNYCPNCGRRIRRKKDAKVN